MESKGYLIVFSLCFLCLYCCHKIDESNTYDKYIEMDGCIYLEQRYESWYTSTKTKELIGCDEKTILKYKDKLGIKTKNNENN